MGSPPPKWGVMESPPPKLGVMGFSTTQTGGGGGLSHQNWGDTRTSVSLDSRCGMCAGGLMLSGCFGGSCRNGGLKVSLRMTGECIFSSFTTMGWDWTTEAALISCHGEKRVKKRPVMPIPHPQHPPMQTAGQRPLGFRRSLPSRWWEDDGPCWSGPPAVGCSAFLFTCFFGWIVC